MNHKKIIRKSSKLQIIITQPFRWIIMQFKKEITLQICSYNLDGEFDAPYEIKICAVLKNIIELKKCV